MFLKRLTNATVRNKWISYRSISISSRTLKSASVNTNANTNSTEKDVIKYRPLTESEIQKIINLDNINIVTKFQTKMPQRPPLVQNFFIGKIDKELLTYPQIALEDYKEVCAKLQPISNYFMNDNNSIDLKFRDVSNQMIADFQRMKLFGSSVHQRYAGSGYFKSEMNLASESEANDIKSYLMLAGHRLAVEAISDHGDISQHNEYLMAMAKGEVIGAVCLHDPLNSTDTESITVTKSPDGEYILNGSKHFVVCSQHANLLIVIGEKSPELILEQKNEEELDDDDDDEFDNYMTFVVDRNTIGITTIDEKSTIGCNDVSFSTVTFTDVHVRKGQILSETIDDRTISEKLIASSRLQSATLNMIQAKKLLSHLLDFTINTKINSEKLRDLNYVRDNLAKLAAHLYGLESMIYLTTGIIDQYDNPKVNLECAITKAYSQDLLKNISDMAMNLVGMPSTINSYPIGQEICDAIQLQYNETSNALKGYIGKIGIQRATEHFGHRANDYKDSFLMRIGFSNPTIEFIEMKQYLIDNLHPSFSELAEELEFSILRLQYSCEMLISRYGKSVADRQIEIRNLGELAMYNYGMFASVGRASRSYCIGLRYSAYETITAGCLVYQATNDILNTALDIKYNRSGYQDVHKIITENALKQYKSNSNQMHSLLRSGLLSKQQ